MGKGGRRAVRTKGALVPVLSSRKNRTTGRIWLVTRVGGWGEAWGGGPWRAGKGGDGVGAPESSVGATKVHWFLGSLQKLTEECGSNKNCIGSFFGDEGGGMGGGVGRWLMEGGQGGEMGGGHQRAVWEQQKMHWLRVGGWGEAWGGGPWRAGKGGSDLAGGEGGGMRGGVGRWPMEGGQGGRMGGGRARKGALVPFFGLALKALQLV